MERERIIGIEMRLFRERELNEACAYVQSGGQALHLFMWFADPKAPKPFRSGGQFGHLMDQDEQRLISTARALGVRVIRVAKPKNRPLWQHIDLVGQPLRRAINTCEVEEEL